MNKSTLLWESGRERWNPTSAKTRQIWDTRRLVEGPEQKKRSFHPPLATGQSSAQKRDLGHPLMVEVLGARYMVSELPD
jgi:hypothetical protein